MALTTLAVLDYQQPQWWLRSIHVVCHDYFAINLFRIISFNLMISLKRSTTSHGTWRSYKCEASLDRIVLRITNSEVYVPHGKYEYLGDCVNDSLFMHSDLTGRYSYWKWEYSTFQGLSAPVAFCCVWLWFNTDRIYPYASRLRHSHWCKNIPNTIHCRYNAVKSLQNAHNRHPIARPWGRNMECPLWFLNLIQFLPLLPQSRM